MELINSKAHQSLQQRILAIQQQLAVLPEGKLICSQNGKYYKYYISNGNSPVYIPKKDYDLAQKLAMRKLLQTELEELIKLRKYWDKVLRKECNITFRSDHFLEENPGLEPLLKEYLHHSNSEYYQWPSESYPPCPKHPENLIHKTLAGHMVRSKSEAIISNMLFSYEIPYRYEYALSLEDILMYPDFTILHPQTHKIFYWEHFGLMDNPSYADKASAKLRVYFQNNIIPSINLITTYETAVNPLDSEEVREQILKHFLN